MTATERTPTIRRNAVHALIAEVSRAGLAAALMLVATRVLGPGQFGLFALAMSFGGLALLPSDFGISNSASRFVAERRGDAAAMAGVLSDALRAKFLLAGLVSVVVLVASPLIADVYNEPGLGPPLRWLALALFAQSVFGLFVGVFVAMGRVSLQIVLYTGESLAETTFVITIVALGGGAAGAMAGRAGGFAVGALIGTVVALRLLGRRIRPHVRHDHGFSRRLVGYAGALFLVDSAWALFGAVDVLLIGAYLASADVGRFEAAARLIVFATMAGSAAASAIGPRLAANEREAPATEALALGLRALTVLSALGAGVLVAWSAPIVELLLGAEYAETADVLRLSAVWVALAIAGPLATMSVNYVGQAGRRVPLVVGALAANLLVDILLIPRIGIEAGAIGTTVGFLIYVPGHLFILRRAVGLDLRRYALTVVRCVVAAAVLAGVLALFGTASLSVLQVVAGAVAGLVAFAGALVATRELQLAEILGAPRAIAQLRRG